MFHVKQALDFTRNTWLSKRILQPITNLEPIEDKDLNRYQAAEKKAPNAPKSFIENLQQAKQMIINLN